MKKPLVSVVFPTMNRKEMLLECLDSLYKQSYRNIEVVIADNGSTDGSIKEVKRRFPKVKIIKNKYNLGSPLAINQCILKSNGEFIFRLDDDMLLEKDCIERMVDVLSSDEKIGAVACTMYYGRDEKEEYWNLIRNMGLSINLWTSKVSVRNNNVNENESRINTNEEIKACGGGMLMIKEEMFRKFGLFDERMFLSFEDAEWCYRMRKHGYKIIQIPKAKLHHRKERYGKMGAFSLLHTVRSKIIFMKKVAGLRNIFFIPFHVLVVLPIMSVKHLVRGELKHLKNYWIGTWQGLFDNRIIAYDRNFKPFVFKRKQDNLAYSRNIRW